MVLTHTNIIANAAGYGLSVSAPPTACLAPGDVHMSYLPLAHIFERTTLVLHAAAGSAVGFYAGDVLKLLEDVVELKVG